MRLLFSLLLAMLIPAMGVHAEDTWTVYTTANSGLPDDWINDILCLDDGTVWIGTQGGASHSDGHSWEVVTTEEGLADDYVSSIAYGMDGSLWFATSGGGLSRLSGGEWTTYIPEVDDLPVRQIHTVLVSSDGSVLAGSPFGCFEFTGDSWQHICSEDLTHFAETSGGVIWAGGTYALYTREGGVWAMKSNDDYYINPTLPLVADAERSMVWFSHLEYTTTMVGHTWYGNGLSTFDGDDWTHYPVIMDIEHVSALDAVIAADGLAWFATDYGLLSYDGSSWDFVTIPDGLTGESIRALDIGPDGSLWIGSRNGVYRYRRLQSSVDEPEPEALPIITAYPNPFNPSTTISFTITSDSHASLTLYNLAGQKVRTLADEPMAVGNHTVVWDGRGDAGNYVAAGIYVMRLNAGGSVATGKMVLVK